ncbi:MAG: mevalonate kinase [Byssovorax sp.]
MKAHGAAHGKVILLGEHAVVYGAPALAAGIDRGARATATTLAPGEPSVLLLGDDRIAADAGSTDDRARAFAALLAEGRAAPSVLVEATSELPAGGGLGSSAAIGVAVGRAVARLFDAEIDGESAARAVAWERIFHGNPSGIDTAAAAIGGCFRFTREHGAHPIPVARPLVLCIGWSGSSSSTRTMVEGVARLHARKTAMVEKSIAGITALVENAALAVEAGDLLGLGRLFDLNQMILAGLLLSTGPIEDMCATARAAGALGAKLTGAGGGGSVIALVGANQSTDEDAAGAMILAAWRAAGFSGFVTRVGVPEQSPGVV